MAKRPKAPEWWPLLLALVSELNLRIEALQSSVDALNTATTEGRATLMAFIDDLEASVAAEKTVDDSILTLLNTLVTAGSISPERAAAVLTALKGEQDRLAAAVVANTPAAPPVTPTP
jgi:hypothetical protein